MNAQSRLSARSSDGAALSVYLVTFGPGDALWERFGHNALWIHDERRGTDVAYHYGLFDFEQEDFLLRFLRGRMRYAMGGFDALPLFNAYAAAGRSIWVQELNLSAARAVRLRDFLEWNARPENRFYRYDYYRDNCSTRVRDALDRIVGGEISRQLAAIGTTTTYRSVTLRLTAGDALLSTGLLLALGPPADRPLSAWEAGFIPMDLREQLRRVSVLAPGGDRLPLVRSERTLFDAERAQPAGLPDGMPSRIAVYLLVGLVAGGVLVAFANRAYRSRSRLARWAFASLGALWGLSVGVFGTVILGLWAVTDHTIAHANENLLQVSPVALALVVLVPAAASGRRWAATGAAWVALLLAVLAVLGLVLQLLPGLDQANGGIIALALPVHLGLAWTLWNTHRWDRPELARRPGSH